MRVSAVQIFVTLVVPALMLTVLCLILFHFTLTREHEFTAAGFLSKPVRTKPGTGRGASSSGGDTCKVVLPEEGLGCRISPLVKYWHTTTDCYTSPLREKNGLSASVSDRRYVVFQPDLGGWNNIRMSLEVTIVFALVTGRILVLPPRSVLYLLNKNKKWEDNKTGVEDYIDFNRITIGRGVELMSMTDFLQEAAVPGRLLKEYPFAKGTTAEEIKGKDLWAYLEQACYSRKWQPGKTFLAFNISSPAKIWDSSAQSEQSARLSAMAIPGQDRRMNPYNAEMDSHRAIFFSGGPSNRLLTLFYAYLFFLRPEEERVVKRFVRDRVRYHDPVYCAGGKIVETMTLRGDPTGHLRVPFTSLQRTQYVAFHIRRGDFQHKWVKISAEEILSLTEPLIPGSRSEKVAYVATDEKNASFFEPFRAAFKQVYFLSDFMGDPEDTYGLRSLPRNHLGMVEQVVCASADIFIGTPLSTFSGYITRMRGYMAPSVPGIYQRTYYYMQKHMYQQRDDPHMHVPFWPREFVEAFDVINGPEPGHEGPL
jgi:hypothetical protein